MSKVLALRRVELLLGAGVGLVGSLCLWYALYVAPLVTQLAGCPVYTIPPPLPVKPCQGPTTTHMSLIQAIGIAPLWSYIIAVSLVLLVVMVCIILHGVLLKKSLRNLMWLLIALVAFLFIAQGDIGLLLLPAMLVAASAATAGTVAQRKYATR